MVTTFFWVKVTTSVKGIAVNRKRWTVVSEIEVEALSSLPRKLAFPGACQW